MVLTDSGITTDSNDVLQKNALLPTVLTELGITIDFNDVQL